MTAGGGEYFVSNARCASDLGLSRDSVKRCVARLVEHDMIQVKRSNKGTNKERRFITLGPLAEDLFQKPGKDDPETEGGPDQMPTYSIMHSKKDSSPYDRTNCTNDTMGCPSGSKQENAHAEGQKRCQDIRTRFHQLPGASERMSSTICKLPTVCPVDKGQLEIMGMAPQP